jgi:hypothetical protein
MLQKMTIIQAKGENKGKVLFEGTTEDFAIAAREDPFFSHFFSILDKPNYKSVRMLCDEQGWEVEYMQQVFNLQLDDRDAYVIRGALADRVKKVSAELEVLKISKDRDLTDYEKSLLPLSLMKRGREELQEQIDSWVSYLEDHKYLLQKVCYGLKGIV